MSRILFWKVIQKYRTLHMKEFEEIVTSFFSFLIYAVEQVMT